MFCQEKGVKIMAKYSKRPDGRYSTSIIIGYDNGKAKRKIFYGRTIAELDKNVSDFKSLKNKGIVIDDEGMTVRQWAEKWLKLYKSDKAYNTYEMYRGVVEKHIVPAFGNIRLKALKTHQIQELINDILHKGHPRAAELVNLTMKQIVKQAMTEEYIYKDITAGITLPKKQKPQKRSLTDAEKELIAKADLSPKERAFIGILYYTGVRRGEALALTVQDIDLVNKKLKVNKNLVMKQAESEIKDSPKTAAGNRQIPIPDKLLKILKEYMRENTNLYLFTMQNGEPMSKSSFRRFWENILDKLNIAAGGDKCSRPDLAKDKDAKPLKVIASDITPHIFRHTYATNLYYAGIDVKTAQTLLGHSSIQMTMDIYTHLDEKKVEEAGNKLNDFFKDV